MSKRRESWGVTLQTVFLAVGLYFFGRIIRNNLYFPLIAPVEAVNAPLYEALRYLGHLVMLGLLFLYFALVKEDRFCLKSAVFTKEKKSFLLLIAGFAAGFLMNGASVLTAILHGDIDMVPVNFDPWMLLLVFVCVFIQSSTEEFQYRLWAHNRIANKTSLGYAIIGSAVAFSLTHMLNNGITFVAILTLLLVSVLYSLSLYCFGNLWFACAHHAAWNFTQNCIFGLPNSGMPATITIMAPTYTKESFFYDPVFGVEGAWITVILYALCVAAFIPLAIKKKKAAKDKQIKEEI